MKMIVATVDIEKYKKVYKFYGLDMRIKEILKQRQFRIDGGLELYDNLDEFRVRYKELEEPVASDDPLGAVIGFADFKTAAVIGVPFEIASGDLKFIEYYFKGSLHEKV